MRKESGKAEGQKTTSQNAENEVTRNSDVTLVETEVLDLGRVSEWAGRRTPAYWKKLKTNTDEGEGAAVENEKGEREGGG